MVKFFVCIGICGFSHCEGRCAPVCAWRMKSQQQLLSLTSVANLYKWARSPRDSPLSPAQHQDTGTPYLGFLYGFWAADLSGPHSYTTSTLLTEPSPQQGILDLRLTSHWLSHQLLVITSIPPSIRIMGLCHNTQFMLC